MVDGHHRFWPAGIAAFMLHGLIIAAVALKVGCPGARQRIPEQALDVEIAFIREADSEVDTCQEQDRQVFDFRQVKQQSKDLILVRPSYSLKKGIAKKTPAGRASLPSHAKKSIKQNAIVTRDAVPLYNPPPAYPHEARRKKIQGVVFVRLAVTALGRVGKVTILSPRTHPILEEAVLRVLPCWRFTPRGRVADIPIEFRLD